MSWDSEHSLAALAGWPYVDAAAEHRIGPEVLRPESVAKVFETLLAEPVRIDAAPTCNCVVAG